MKNTIVLISTLFFALLLLPCDTRAQSADLSADEFEKAISLPDVQVLDVRTTAEYKTGFIKHALLSNWNNQAEFAERTNALDKSKPVYVYCLGGPRSSAAAKKLNEQGFKAYNLVGGISGWKRAGKPVEQAIQVKQITMEEYIALIPADKTVLVDIGAEWCPPCRKMNPIVDSLVQNSNGKFVLIRIDGGQQTDLCTQLKAETFPSFIIYKQGKEVARKQGVVDAAVLANLLH